MNQANVLDSCIQPLAISVFRSEASNPADLGMALLVEIQGRCRSHSRTINQPAAFQNPTVNFLQGHQTHPTNSRAYTLVLASVYPEIISRWNPVSNPEMIIFPHTFRAISPTAPRQVPVCKIPIKSRIRAVVVYRSSHKQPCRLRPRLAKKTISG